MKLTVARSPARLITLAVLSVPAILLAIDMTVSYRFIRHPETRDVVVGQTTDESGQQVDVTKPVLTDTGLAERRRDILLGGGLFFGGAAALGWSLRQLMRPTPFISADDDGLLVRVDGIRQPPRRYAWSEIAEVRSGVVDDDGVDTPVLSIRLVDDSELPVLPAGGVTEGQWLHLFSTEWEMPAHQVAARLDHLLDRPRAMEDDGG